MKTDMHVEKLGDMILCGPNSGGIAFYAGNVLQVPHDARESIGKLGILAPYPYSNENGLD